MPSSTASRSENRCGSCLLGLVNSGASGTTVTALELVCFGKGKVGRIIFALYLSCSLCLERSFVPKPR